jgi:hypothetical protein
MTLFPSRTLNKRRLFANPRQRCIAPMDFATKRLRHTASTERTVKQLFEIFLNLLCHKVSKAKAARSNPAGCTIRINGLL